MRLKRSDGLTSALDDGELTSLSWLDHGSCEADHAWDDGSGVHFDLMIFD